MMSHFAFFLLATFIPWLLGFAMIKPFLKQRQGYLFFAMGAGYLLGWFTATFILRIYDYFGRPFNIYEVVVIECAITVLLLFLKARELRFDEIGLEKPLSKLGWFLSGLIVCLLLYRWGLTAIDLINKPVFPWDGWLSWSAKAKVFYFIQGIPTFHSEATPFWIIGEPSFALVGGGRHPFFISLVQTYMAMSWGSWSDTVVNLPWLGVGIAVFLSVLGALRYLGINILLATLAGYAVVSLPVLDIHTSLGAYADLWVGYALFCAVSSLFFVINYKEWPFIFPLFAFCTIAYFSKNTALVFILSLWLLPVWLWVGSIWGIFILVFTVCLCAVGNVFFGDDIINLINTVLSTGFDKTMLSYNAVEKQIWHEWFVLDNWHYTFIASLVSLTILTLTSRKNNSYGTNLFILVAITFVLTMLVITLLTAKMPSWHFVMYFNRVTLYFVLVYVLILVAVYQLCLGNDCRETV